MNYSSKLQNSHNRFGMVKDYEGLLNGERSMFNAGESSLFLINSREVNYINAQLKLVELLAKRKVTILALNYSLGIYKNL